MPFRCPGVVFAVWNLVAEDGCVDPGGGRSGDLSDALAPTGSSQERSVKKYGLPSKGMGLR